VFASVKNTAPSRAVNSGTTLKGSKTMLDKMKKKTYRNFLIVRNKLMNEKGYDPKTAADLAHRIFKNYSLDSFHTIKDYYDRILTREEFESQH
jgi:Mn-dependent DtxR family transcriptional regulator